MRARNIKPGFWKNEQLVSCDPVTRLLFIGLWGIADREGRLSDSPIKIKIELFPCDHVDVESMLKSLASVGLIDRYEIDGKRYIQVVNFAKHQSPHHLEKSSTIPPNSGRHPGNNGTSPVNNETSPVKEPDVKRFYETSPVNEPVLEHLGNNCGIQDSGFRIQGKEEGFGEKPPAGSAAANLAALWMFHRRGAHTEHDRRSADNFADLLAAGVTEASLAAAIASKDRAKTEPIWEFCKRFKPKPKSREPDCLPGTMAFLAQSAGSLK
jgi:hypothetical protein